MIESLLDELIRREGGYVNHPADRGGPTKYGITAKTLGEWRKLGRPATAAETQALTVEEARQIYRAQYVAPFEAIRDERLLSLVVDGAVHSGVAAATRWLQQALGLTADGVIGPKTRERLAKADPEALYRKVLAQRLRHLGRLITQDPRQAAFAAGWMNRLAEFVEAA